jgi:hypothetical protein
MGTLDKGPYKRHRLAGEIAVLTAATKTLRTVTWL